MRRLSLLFALGATLAPALLHGQKAASLPDLQVTATRIPVARDAVPAAVTVLHGKDLRDRGITTLLDALRLAPSASVVQAGSYGAVTSLFMRGGESDYTKVLVDGVVINEPGGSINLATISLDNVERIEIVRGPGSVLYGADAMSGVIQLFTRRGEGPVHGGVEATAGSFHGRDVRGHATGASGAWSTAFAGSRFVSDGIYPFNADFGKTVGSAAIGWEGGRGSRVDVTARYTDAVGHFPTDGNGDPVDVNQRTLSDDLVLGLRASHPVSRGLELTAEVWSHRLNSRFRDERDTPGDSMGFAFAGTRDAVTSRRGVTVRSDWRLRPTMTIVAGAGIETEKEDQSSVTESDFGSGGFADSSQFLADRTTRSAYLQLRAAPLSSVTVQIGGRVDDNTDFGSFTTVRAGAVAHLSERSRVWGSFGTGFKAPTFSEILADSPYEVGNPTLRPEKSRSAELGMEVGTASVRAGLTLFTQNFSQFVQYISANPGDPTYTNLGAARSRGVEGSVTLAASRALTVDAQVTWLSTAVTDTGATSSPTFRRGQSLLRRPSLSGVLTLRGFAGQVSYAASGRWVGSRDDVSFRDFPAARIQLPSYVLFDASLTVPAPVGTALAADLLLRGENLFNTAWESTVGYPGRGRTLFGGMRLTF